MLRSISCIALMVALVGCFERDRIPTQAASPEAPGGGAAARAAAPTSAARGAPSAKACADALARWIGSGDMAGMATLIPAPEGPAVEAVESAKSKVRAAVDAKFGTGAAAALGIGSDSRGAGKKIDVVSVAEAGEEATAVLRMSAPDGRSKERPQRLVRIDGAWFLAPEKTSGAEGRARDLGAAAKALEALAADVAAGKVASKDAAGDRYADVVSKAGV